MPNSPQTGISSAVSPPVTTFKLSINNLSELPDGCEIFILAMGINPSNPAGFDPASQSYVRFDDTGLGTLENVTHGTKSEDYSRTLSSFKQKGVTVLQIPNIGKG